LILVDSSVWIDYFRGTATPQIEKRGALRSPSVAAAS
jgi:predicted nucleic acid-binding protein